MPDRIAQQATHTTETATPRLIHTTGAILSPTLDTAIVDAGRWLIGELRRQGLNPTDTATDVAAFLKAQVAHYAPKAA